MRLAAEFEAAEGRDLRGLLDFLASRAAADADAHAATALEGHDGVRIMTVHSAKGLEFDVVAVPGLSRGLLAAKAAPLLALGHEPDSPRVGMQLRRLGAAAVNLYANERALRGGAGARGRGGAAPLPRRRDAGARAAPPQRRGPPRAAARDQAGHAGGRADRRGFWRRPRPPIPRSRSRPPLRRAGLEVSFAPSRARGAGQPRLPGAGGGADRDPARGGPRRGGRRGAGAAARAAPAGRRSDRSPTRRSPSAES